MEQLNINELQLIGNKLVFPREFRIKHWGEQFGPIQEKLHNNQYKHLIVDFTNLTWIDPLPLLSLQISLKKIKDVKVELHLPIADSTSNYLLAFIYSEGFLDQFPKNTKVYSGGNLVEDYSIYERYIDTLNYSNCSIIKAHVVDINREILNSDYKVNSWISDIVSSSQFHLKNKVESYVADDVIGRLRILLSETISNVFEHAYPQEKTKYVGFYVRFRKGLGNTRVPKSEYISLKKLIGNEHLTSPKLNRYFIDNIFSFLEIFIIDSGCGLSTNYFPKNKDVKHPFREAWRLAVFKGQRGLFTEGKKTQFGGLYHVYKKLGNNYIWARDNNEWIGHEAPSQEEGSFFEEIEGGNTNIKGLALIYRLTWDVASDEELYWHRISDSRSKELEYNIHNHPFLHELSYSISIYDREFDNSFSKDSYFVIDHRYDFSSPYIETIYKNKNEGIHCCFYFPSRFIQKNEVFDSINKHFESIKTISKSLIICDILVFEANLFQLAIENASFSDEFINNYERIILVSERFSILILEKDHKTKRFKKSSKVLKQEFRKSEFLPYIYIDDIIAWIRTHDSLLFWELIRKKGKDGINLYVNSPILWYSGEVDYIMNGYLNFAQVISDSDSNKIIEASLNRISCFAKQGDPNSVEFINIDILTSQLTLKMNMVYSNNVSTKENSFRKILLGSVYVSGMSQYDKEL